MLSLSTFLLPFCLASTYSLSSYAVHNTNLDKLDLPRLIGQYFSSCDLYVTDDDPSKAADYATTILASFTDSLVEPPQLILHLSSYFQERNWNSSRCNHISCFPVKPRKYSHCSLAVGIFFQGGNKLPQFNELLFSPYAAPLRNERDHVLFLTGHDVDLGSFLQHDSLSTVKYKLGLTLEEPSVMGKTNCFYCNNGQYELKDIDMSEVKSLSALYPDYSKNGFGRVLRASGPTKYPFLYELEHVGNDQWKSKRGVYHFALEVLIPHFNFSFSVYPSRNGGSGTHFDNGTWDGVIGDMVYSRADFGTASSANPERYLLVTFTNFPISYIYVTYMMGPPRKTYSWKAIYWPFATDLWVGLLLSILVVIFLFKGMDRIINLQRGRSIYRHLVENVSFALIGQGYDCADPDAHAARFLLAVWLFATIIFNTLYVSQVVGLLAFPLYQTQPFTFKALTESGYQWGFDRSGGSLFAHFKLSTNAIFHEIFERKLPEQDAIDCFSMALKEDFACITWSGVADYTAYKNLTIKHGKSPLVFADEKTQFIPSGIMLPRRNLHLQNFNSIIGMLTDSGQNDKWLSMDYENLRKAKVQWQHSLGLKGDDDGPDEEDMLSLSNLLGIFYIYILGHVISLGLFLWEHVKARKGANKNRTGKQGPTDRIGNTPSFSSICKGYYKFIVTLLCGVNIDFIKSVHSDVKVEEVISSSDMVSTALRKLPQTLINMSYISPSNSKLDDKTAS